LANEVCHSKRPIPISHHSLEKKKIIFYNPTLVGGPSEEGNWVIGGIGVGIAIKKLNLFALFNNIGSVYLGL